MNNRVRNTPFYPISKIKEAIKNRAYEIDDEALENARKDFGWSTEDIEKAFLKLTRKHFSHAVAHFTKPKLWVDHYRAYGLMGENVYTHVHFEDGILQIESLKRK